ncbi:DUF1203 domain-containing protein [Oryzibacter oryziterrae]|uniref:DUF1203 domain-containing protein n=1 Tax=Oryzibacter oryziterrae TaxID=2766474 RepID=UPI001F2FF616|nr:DUF1203 domain-containing protein [Oryzibacter oryziterrae]
MAYRISGLSPDVFRFLHGLDDAALDAHGVKRLRVDKTPGYPDRITLTDAPVGQSVLLLNYEHQPAPTPYRSRHAIFVLEGAEAAFDEHDVLPEVMRTRILSLRGFDADGWLKDADVAQGDEVEPTILRLFANPSIAYIHVHYAKHGCYAARVDRA